MPGRAAMPPPPLGVGVVWWPPLDPLCDPAAGLVDVVEVEPEPYWLPQPGGGFRSVAAAAVAHLPQPRLLHGVGAPLAGTCLADAAHAAAFAADARALRPAFVSAHLNLTHFRPPGGGDPVFAGVMLPPAQSEAGAALAAANIRRQRSALGGMPVAVETPVSYLPPLPGEMPDGQYVAAVAEAAGCGILLDIHNVLCNARNGRQGVAAYCDALPPEQVWELHLGGGEDTLGFYVDAHAGLPPPEALELAAALVPRLPALRAIVFEIMPERVAETGLDAIAGLLWRLREIWDTRGRDTAAAAARAAAPSPRGAEAVPPPREWETLLGAAVVELPGAAPPAALAGWWEDAAPALRLYRRLAGEGRASAVAAAAPRTTRLLLGALGGRGTRDLLAAFWRATPPLYTAAEEAAAFHRFLADALPEQPGLHAAIAADAADLAAVSAQSPSAWGSQSEISGT
ncbi:MAG: DUF692 family protein [Proteobacteria bacterium]|nr:DUF692 family protein [Pseudomonadota bacterium]